MAVAALMIVGLACTFVAELVLELVLTSGLSRDLDGEVDAWRDCETK